MINSVLFIFMYIILVVALVSNLIFIKSNISCISNTDTDICKYSVSEIFIPIVCSTIILVIFSIYILLRLMKDSSVNNNFNKPIIIWSIVSMILICITSISLLVAQNHQKIFNIPGIDEYDISVMTCLISYILTFLCSIFIIIH